MWFKHRAWIPAAWLLSAVNIGAVWFAAQPAETWHATSHALIAVLFAVGAQRLTDRRRSMNAAGNGTELPADVPALRGELRELRQGNAEVLERVEQSIGAIAIELERVGEGQRFLTKTLAEQPGPLAREANVPDKDSQLRASPTSEVK